MNKILDSDDEDLANLSDSCSHTSSMSTPSSKGSKSSLSTVTKLKIKENSDDMKMRRKSCVPNLMAGNVKEPSLVTRITRNSIKTQPTWTVKNTTNKNIHTPTKNVSVKLEKINTTVFDFDDEEENNVPLSYVTRSGRKAKNTNPSITKEETDENENDEDYKHVENESESDSEHSDEIESESNNFSSDSDLEVFKYNAVKKIICMSPSADLEVQLTDYITVMECKLN